MAFQTADGAIRRSVVTQTPGRIGASLVQGIPCTTRTSCARSCEIRGAHSLQRSSALDPRAAQIHVLVFGG
jgi:hypothetical protein